MKLADLEKVNAAASRMKAFENLANLSVEGVSVTFSIIAGGKGGQANITLDRHTAKSVSEIFTREALFAEDELNSLGVE